MGKSADLVLLEGNPLQDIANTRRIAAVMRLGRLFTRAQLDSLLAISRGDSTSAIFPPSKLLVASLRNNL